MADKKTIQASDNNILKRFVKKHFGTTYLEEMTDKELQDVRDKPDSVFGKLKRIGKVDSERARRKYLLDKSFKDKVLRDHSEMLKDLNLDKLARKRLEEKRKKAASKASGGKIYSKTTIRKVPITD